jgi:cytochrome bd-type quinol oxidase subunit 1
MTGIGTALTLARAQFAFTISFHFIFPAFSIGLAEVLSAFFLEAGFLGVMLFGINKVGTRRHFLATCMVAAGTLPALKH